MRALLALTIAALLFTPAAMADVEFESGVLQPGESFEFTFTELDEGGQWYHCRIHPDMVAMVHVFAEGDLSNHEAGTNSFEVSIDDDGTAEGGSYSIMHLSIEVGDTVIWTNNGELPHTVTWTPDSEEQGHAPEGAHNDDGHDHGDHQDAPGFGVPLAIGALGLFGLVRRRQ